MTSRGKKTSLSVTVAQKHRLHAGASNTCQPFLSGLISMTVTDDAAGNVIETHEHAGDFCEW
jgi:hypothetical protein